MKKNTKDSRHAGDANITYTNPELTLFFQSESKPATLAIVAHNKQSNCFVRSGKYGAVDLSSDAVMEQNAKEFREGCLSDRVKKNNQISLYHSGYSLGQSVVSTVASTGNMIGSAAVSAAVALGKSLGLEAVEKKSHRRERLRRTK